MAKTNLARKLANVQAALKTFGIAIPNELAEQYTAQAEAAGVDVEAILAERLNSCVGHTSDKPLYFTDSDRQAIERLLDSNFNAPDRVIEKLRELLKVVSLSDGVNVEPLVLSPMRMYRLSDRARARGTTIAQLALKLANDAIDREIGLF